MIITIDGPSGTGKSTITQRLAERLGFMELDTGALYRAISAACLYFQIDPHDEGKLKKFIKKHPLHVDLSQKPPSYSINKVNLTPFIRSLEVTSIVSYVAAHPFVRQELLPLQREIASGLNIICEGRDMGTTVFPMADIKFFLTASPEVRAKRRYDEFKEKEMITSATTLESIQSQIIQRDEIDQGRKASPLRKANDAIEVDTSSLTIEEVVETLIKLIP
jgi:cytidylate kinase